jgi:hypothetical protein
MRRVLVAVAMLLFLLPLVGGCGGDEDAVVTELQPLPASKTNNVRVYFLRDGKVWPALREVPKELAQANEALDELFRGPTEQEAAELRLTTALPDDLGTFSLLAPPAGQGGAVSLHLGRGLPLAARAQVVFTLTQFPLIDAVVLGDRTYRRDDFEDLTPAILVESPLSFEQVSSPLHVFGSANTFEATFNYELTDTDGRIVAEDFVTATSGTGTRGAFEFVVPFEVDFDGVGSLIVFERSAKDGSRINLVEIPLRMTE